MSDVSEAQEGHGHLNMDLWGFSALLDLVKDDGQVRRIVLERSCRHPNGFLRMVLLDASPYGKKLRLHVWNASSTKARAEPDVHDHHWGFKSLVLCGELQAEAFVEVESSTPDSQVFEKYALSPSIDGSAGFCFVGRRSLLRTDRRVLGAGETHALCHDDLHRIDVKGNELTATLMLQGAWDKETSSVFRPCGVPLPARIEPERLREAEVIDVLDQLSKRLCDQGVLS